MEGSLLNQPRSVRTLGHVLRHVQLTGNFSTYDEYLILRVDNVRKDRNLHGRHPNLLTNNG